MKKVLAIITAIVMMVMMMPVAALAEQAAEEENWNSYTLYNYISLDNGKTYISLETQENGIKTQKSAEQFHKENGNKRYDLNKDEYRIAGYDLSSLVIKHNGVSYVEKSAAKEGQPYFTAKLDRVESVQCANFRDSSNIEPKTTKFESLGYSYITFHRNWYISFTVPTGGQKLLTGIQMPDGKYYGIDYTGDFDAIDSRTIPFNTKLSAGQYSIKDYDFSNLELNYQGETYSYRPEGPVAGDGQGFHYYTVSLMKIDKLAKSTYGGGYLKEGWPSWPLISGTQGEDGYAYKAGYYHRDYKVTLHIGDAPEAESVVVEEPTVVEETIVTEEPIVEESTVVEETVVTEEPAVEESAVVEESIVTEDSAVEESTIVEETVNNEVEEVNEEIEEKAVVEENSTVEEETIVNEESAVEEAAETEEAVTEEIEENTAVEENTVEAETETVETAEVEETVEEAVETEEVETEEVAETEEVETAVQETAVEEEMPAEEEVQAAAVKTEAPAKKNNSKSIIVKDEQPVEAAEETVAEKEVPLYGMVEENIETENVPLVNYVQKAEKNEAAAESTGWSLADMMFMIATIVAAVVFILTQDMGGMMKMFDRWTILMGVLFTAGTMMMATASRKTETR